MSSVEETSDRYEIVCKELGQQPNKYIIETLDKQKKACKGAESMQLYLAGNNILMTDSRLTDDDAKALYLTLKNNVFVTSLDLRYNNLTDTGCEHLAQLLEETIVLRQLNVMCNDFGEEGAKHIAKALHRNETLTDLRLNGNKVGNRGGMYFAQALQINVCLRSLDLGDTDLKTESVIALATVLNHNSTLVSLNVNRPILFSHQEETTVHFANMIKVNRTLRELHLRKYDMRDFGAIRLSENLMHNFYLTYLDLSCNRLTRDGALKLAELLRSDTPLQVLHLGYNRLGDSGAQHLANALAGFNTNLTSLSLVHNEINGKGLCAIADCMKLNATLSSVFIWGNNLEESACIAFASLLDTGRLESANTDVEPYIVDGTTYMSELSNGLQQNYYWGPSYGNKQQAELAA